MARIDSLPAADDPARFVSMAAAADFLGCSVDTIRRRIADGTLPAYRVGTTSTIRVRLADVLALVERIPTITPDR
jgi:excisionase family DNA binding protein